ncbi:hypothetical protein ACWEKT_30070 [Nocardia takedensis]
MTARGDRSLGYPVAVTLGVVAVCAATTPWADPDQLAALVVVVAGVLGYSAWRFAVALGLAPHGLPSGTARVRRVRNQDRLVSRSWLEVTGLPGGTRWLPVYFDPALPSMVEGEARIDARSVRTGTHRWLPSGRPRRDEPRGRLLDNPSRPDPDAGVRAIGSARTARRLLLDAQSAVAAPVVGLLWVYVVGGGVWAFAGVTVVVAAVTVWSAAIGGSDPS